jgi:hypothetical protein
MIEGFSYKEWYGTDRWKWSMIAKIITPQLTHHDGEEISLRITMNPDMNSFHCRVDSAKGYSSYYWSKCSVSGRWGASKYSYGIQKGTPKLETKELIHLTESEKLWERV